MNEAEPLSRRISVVSLLEPNPRSQDEVLRELEEISPGVPLLALGQTVFWDEPMKAGVALALQKHGFERKLIAGVHDTDYFARYPGQRGERGFKALPHNDTTTQALWSAAAEFSSLFGSETVVTRDDLQRAAVRLPKLMRDRPGILDQATEAYGWRGVVAMGDDDTITAEMPLNTLFPELFKTLEGAVRQTMDSLANVPEASRQNADQLLKIACDSSEDAATLSEYYQRLIPDLYEFVAGQPIANMETAASSRLLQFNRDTASLPRFNLVDSFLNPLTRGEAVQAYNDTVSGTEIYTLDRFGSFALPFDVIVPGHGRGTLRVANKAVIIMTPTPLFISTKQPVTSVQELAAAIERKFGRDCILVGKAVSLIGMLSREFIFVFHEGASSYVRRSAAFHARLFAEPPALPFHPILRVRYQTWDALGNCCAWLRLPEPFRQPFGVDEVCAPTLASRWRQVVQEQATLLADLGRLRSPVQFIRWLAERGFGSWMVQAEEYDRLHDQLAALEGEIAKIKAQKSEVLGRFEALKTKRGELERQKGEHWRAFCFEKTMTPEHAEQRKALTEQIQATIEDIAAVKAEWRVLDDLQRVRVRSESVTKVHDRRRQIELEAELKRLNLARRAVLTSKGWVKAGLRPSAWWFPLISPDGKWFATTASLAEYYLEPLYPLTVKNGQDSVL